MKNLLIISKIKSACNPKLLAALGLTAGILCLNACTTGTPELSGMSPQAQAKIIKDYGGIYKVGNPYKVMGRWYYPKEDYNYKEEGMASWYGEDFNGKKTANGERYNMNTLTAAHRTLPLPSIVKVTNLQNGRSIVVRVNDRGPYVKERIIDLSKRGATLLGYMGQGTTKVRVEIMAKESKQLKEAMLTGNVSPDAEETFSPAPSLYESSAERQKIAAEIQKADEAAIYATAGGKEVMSGTYKPTGQTAEPVAYGSAATKDGEVRSGSIGVMSANAVKVSDNKGIYGTAASNPDKKDTQAVNKAAGYQYLEGYYYIHTGAFSNYALAHQQTVRLKEYGTAHIVPTESGGKKLYRVSMGPYSRIEEAKVAQAKLLYYGIKDTRIEQK
ncbi:MAG: septal ring lytic transglycosylase RlpA family protein [Alphaproteobacteria bacterium]|nr:septal ring lytic transglycosylase RlpA family protein [Alphaproteobacteria bacterium]